MSMHSPNTFPGLLRMYGPSTRLVQNLTLEAEVRFRGGWYDIGLFFGTERKDVLATAWSLLYRDQTQSKRIATLLASPSRRLYSRNGLTYMGVRDLSVLTLDGDSVKEQYMGILQEVNRVHLHKIADTDMLFRVRNDYFVVVPFDEPRWDYR